MKTLSAFLFCVMFVTAVWPASAGVPSVEVSDKGVVTATLDGRSLLLPGTPGISWIKDDEGKPINPGAVVTTGDMATRTVASTYGWGSLVTTFGPVDGGIRINVRIVNASTVTVNHIIVNLVRFRSLGDHAQISRPANGITGPLLAGATGETGSVVLSASNEGKPLELELRKGGASKTKEQIMEALIELGGDKVIVDNVLSSHPLVPGAVESFTVELKFGAAGVSYLALAKPVLDTYRASNPRLLKWDDRRPILRLFFGGGLSQAEANANLKDPDKVTALPVDAKFRDFVLKRMASTIEAAKSINAQAVIMWDLEGGTYPHATTYIGDPRHIRLLNPQMDLVIDEAMRLLTDAGIKVGVTLRPSHVVFDPVKNTAKHKHEGYDPYEELDAKVAYARKRWGCKVFYVDTNFFWRPYGREKKWQSGQLTADLWKRLLTKYPDTLFIPEFGNYADYAYVAAYGEADMGDYATPELVRAIWPDAFRILVIEDADAYVNYDRFVSAVRGGNVLMTYSFDARGKNTVALRRIYQEARLLEDGEPVKVREAEKSDLVANLTSADVAVRYFSASRLADLGDASTADPLLARATDTNEEWIVRRQAIRAFEKIACSNAVPVLTGLAIDQKTLFYAAASKALAGQGTPASHAVVSALESNPGLPPIMIELLGDVLVKLKASDQVPRLMSLYDTSVKATSPHGRELALIKILGELGNKAAEPLLLKAFTNPSLQSAAATALIRLGSVEGVARVDEALAKAKADRDSRATVILSDAIRRAQR